MVMPRGLAIGVCLGLFAVSGLAAAEEETKLYDTGPSVISGYVRFVNAAQADVTITAGSGGTLALETGMPGRIGRFQAVPARLELTATLAVAGKTAEVSVTLLPDEFVTIAVLDGAASLVLRDQPQDFNALKADIAFLNADPGCAGGVMRAGAKKTVVFSEIPPGQLARRSVNPVAALIEAGCSEAAIAGTLDLGLLEAGKRYSVVVIPDGAGGHALIGGQDERARY